MKITLEPTEEFFAAKDILIRAWRGTDENGADVVAFVAGVAIDQEAPQPEGMVPVPMPAPDWQAEARALAGSLWQLLGQIPEAEALRVLKGSLVLSESLLVQRGGFGEITRGWLMDDFVALTERIERLARWTMPHYPMLPHETLTVKAMIDRQIAIGPDLTQPPPGDPT